MKKIILFFLTLTTMSFAFSPDQFVDEIVCERLKPQDGLEVVIQSNPTAWVKRVVVIDNSGFAGPKEIGSFQVPIKPQLKYDSELGWNHNYETQNFSLKLKVVSAGPGQYQVPGPAVGNFSIKSMAYEGPFQCYKK